MTVVGLHPEELFDKLSDGTLSSSERQRLHDHLATCEVCRFEHAVRADFCQEAGELLASTPPPLRQLGAPELLPRLISGAGSSHRAVERVRQRRRLRSVVWSISAAALITATGAVAASDPVQRTWQAVEQLLSPRSTAPRSAPAPRPRAPVSAPVASASVAQTATPTPVEQSVAPGEAPAPEARPSSLTAAPPALAVAPSKSTPMSASAVATPEAPSPAKLFADANLARRAGDVAHAVELYHELQTTFAGSAEAELSRVTLALLQLDSGDPQAALSGFDRYLTGPSRALEAEAMVGRARALGRLGLRDLELFAWREVLRKYPTSIYARQASERLSAPGQP